MRYIILVCDNLSSLCFINTVANYQYFLHSNNLAIQVMHTVNEQELLHQKHFVIVSVVIFTFWVVWAITFAGYKCAKCNQHVFSCLWPAAKRSTNLAHNTLSMPDNSELLTIVTSAIKSSFITEIKIAPYPHHLLWLPYHSCLPHTSQIKSQSFISTYKPTPLPPQLILSHLHPLFYSTISLLPPYSKSTIYSLNHLIPTVISILFLPPY